MRTRLRFTVGTALLVAPLASSCTDKPRVNPGPEPEGPHINVAHEPEQKPTVNEGPVADPEQPEQPEEPDPPHVNPGPNPNR